MPTTRRVIALLAASLAVAPAWYSGAVASAQATGATVKATDRIPAGGVLPAANALSAPRPSTLNPDAGASLFGQMNCDGCHGGGAVGWVGPSLVDGRWRYGGADDEIFTSIFYGRPKGMPAYGGVIGTDGVWMLVAYIKAQAVPAVVPTTSWLPGGNAAAAPPAAAVAPDQLPAKYGCTGCHAADHKVVGPSFKDVAAKYAGKDVEAALIEKIKKGGSGVWGETPMPPNPQVPEPDLHAIVKWILTLK